MDNEERFLAYTNFIIDNLEGGFVNDPKDSGGATKYGITERVARRHNYLGDMKDLPRDTAIEIYRADYWNGKIMESISNNLAFHIYDASINSGYDRAIKILQGSLGVSKDGVLGPATLNALSNLTEAESILRYNIERMDFYCNLRQYKDFGRGWRNRLFKCAAMNWSNG